MVIVLRLSASMKRDGSFDLDTSPKARPVVVKSRRAGNCNGEGNGGVAVADASCEL